MTEESAELSSTAIDEPDTPADVPHNILVVDDIPDNVDMLSAHLRTRGYTTLSAFDGEEAIIQTRKHLPDLLMLDVNMPKKTGLDVCSILKKDPLTSHIPIILVTANSETEEIVRGFELGADDYLIKPYNYMEMLARVRSMLRIRASQQALEQANAALDELNQTLEDKVQKQVEELQRVNKLRRFFSPQLTETIISGHDDMLKEHRREITVVFLDLRNFTSFAEQVEPEVVFFTIREMHSIVGPIIFRHRGTLERFSGDGIMVFLGDPEPMENHACSAVEMTRDIRHAMQPLQKEWEARGYPLGLGIGIATGIASLGTIGFEGRMDYAAIGNATNLAARLCGRADIGQILIAERTQHLVADTFETKPCGEISLKGFARSHTVYELP